jgi:hypothetical protein
LAPGGRKPDLDGAVSTEINGRGGALIWIIVERRDPVQVNGGLQREGDR